MHTQHKPARAELVYGVQRCCFCGKSAQMTKGTERDVLRLQLETRIQLGSPLFEKATER